MSLYADTNSYLCDFKNLINLIYIMELTTPHISPKADSRVVWLDVVRLIAMFTVVCCHCTDPFNFYPGTAPDIVDIKFWGGRLWSGVASVCAPFCDDNRSVVASGAWRCVRIL